MRLWTVAGDTAGNGSIKTGGGCDSICGMKVRNLFFASTHVDFTPADKYYQLPCLSDLESSYKTRNLAKCFFLLLK